MVDCVEVQSHQGSVVGRTTEKNDRVIQASILQKR